MITEDSFIKVPSDINGNPRYACHFTNLMTDSERITIPTVSAKYKAALARAKRIGGRKYHNKRYGGGIVFQAYSAAELVKECNKLVAEDSEE